MPFQVITFIWQELRIKKNGSYAIINEGTRNQARLSVLLGQGWKLEASVPANHQPQSSNQNQPFPWFFPSPWDAPSHRASHDRHHLAFAVLCRGMASYLVNMYVFWKLPLICSNEVITDLPTSQLLGIPVSTNTTAARDSFPPVTCNHQPLAPSKKSLWLLQV